jgi:hypothetical protein
VRRTPARLLAAAPQRNKPIRQSFSLRHNRLYACTSAGPVRSTAPALARKAKTLMPISRPIVLLSAAILADHAGAVRAQVVYSEPPSGAPQVSTGPAAAPTIFTLDQLDALLAPIALYPDPLIAEVLAASTDPIEVVQAARWAREHPDLAGLETQNWDPSVKAVAHYPTVLAMMDANLDWMMQLGQAFLNQQQDVMSEIQQLRARAWAAGTLRTTPQQQVVVQPGAIAVLPAEPDVVYVPTYNPQLVYVRPANDLVAASLIGFGTGVFIGPWLDLDFDWGFHRVYYHDWYRGRDRFDRDDRHPFVDRREFTRPAREGQIWHRDPARPWPRTIRPDEAGPRALPGHSLSRPTRPGLTAPAPVPAPRGAFDGYRRGTESQQHSARGQTSRDSQPAAQTPAPVPPPRPAAPAPAPRPAAPAPAPAPRPAAPPAAPRPAGPPAVIRPTGPPPAARPPAPSAPRPSTPAPAAPRPAPAPAARPAAATGAFGPYRSGAATQADSQRGAASHGAAGRPKP